MKSIAIQGKSETGGRFPKLMVNSKAPELRDDTIILATEVKWGGEKYDHLVGTVVYTSGKHYSPGHHSKTWDASFFIDFVGVVQLENDA